MAEHDLPKDVLTDLIDQSFAMKERAYCPYSGCRVGAALLCIDGSIFTGCNVEYAGRSPNICAERTAIVKAVSEDNRTFRAIVIASDRQDFISPCDVCRQTMSEFAENMSVYMTRPDKRYKKINLRKLLLGKFFFKDLEEERVGT